jgi:hypothetical protein
MPPKHGPWRARVLFDPVADRQIRSLSDSERVRLDKVIVQISADPTLGFQVPGRLERTYRRDGVVVVYLSTALGTVVLVLYVEA